MIDKYIHQLLDQNIAVSIPKIGTFRTVQENATTDTQEHVIQPPRKKFSFDTYVDENDEALKNAVIEGEQIDEEDYDLQINKFLENIEAQIITFGEYKLKNIGILTKNTNGEYIFNTNQESSGNSYGLPPVTATPIHREPQKTMSKKTEPKPKKASSSNMIWMIIIPLICLLAFLVFLSTHKGGMQELKSLFGGKSNQEITEPVSDNVSEIIETVNDSIDEMDDEDGSLTDVIDNIADEVTDATDEIKDNLGGETPPPAQNTDNQNYNTSEEGVSAIVKGKYYIVTGSFSSVKAASSFIKKSSLSGLKIIPYTAKNMYRVVIGEFDSEVEATNKMSEYGIPSMWVVKT